MNGPYWERMGGNGSLKVILALKDTGARPGEKDGNPDSPETRGGGFWGSVS